MVLPGWSIGCFLLTLATSAFGLEVIRYDRPEVICSQGLSECTMKDELLLTAAKNDDLDVRELSAKAALCCSRAACSLCLLIDAELYIHPNAEMENEGYSGFEEEDDSEESRNLKACVTLCYNTAAILPSCKKVEFTVNPAALSQQHKTQLSIVINKPVGVSFSSSVFIHPSKQLDLRQEVSVPSLDEVCSPEVQERINECEVPTFSSIINLETNQMELQVAVRDKSLSLNMCLQYELNGKCQLLNRRSIPLYSVTTCTCFQVWWDKGDHRSRRSVSCPFINHTDVFQMNVWKNLTVSVVHGQMSDHGEMLLWNLSAPCRLEAEVWPCHRTAGEKGCKEIKGFRQQVVNRNWRRNSKGHWEKFGVFEDINLQLSPCVMVKVKRMEHELEPFCFKDTGRWRWSLLVVAMVLLVCLTALISCLLHDTVKRWVWSWHHGGFVKSGKGHVVLLSPPEVDGVVSQSVCGLGSLLCDHGFSVAVDQWTRKDQCSLGPLPWLHSQLLKLDRLGGQVVLVLTRKALERAEEWTYHHKEFINRKKEDKSLPHMWTPYSDVFTASLCLIQADKQLGRARERFLLVNFDSDPAQFPSRDKSLPELLQDLALFQLPSQAQSLLAELTGRGSGRGTWAGRKWGASNGWRTGTKEKLDQQRTSTNKSVGDDRKWETTALNQPSTNMLC
ncbi:hypothetical protein LDENG_00276020 [Lucifuga dentata]|nr:hypothetical protein LDENG_00276020 [Lucifuga dentata]